MVIRLTKSNILAGLLAVIVIGAENCFYLVDASSINIAGVFNYQDFFWVLGFLWLVYVLFAYQRFPNPKYNYWPFIIGIVLLVIVSSIQSKKLYGMPLSMGIRPQRYWLLWAFMYFPISKLLYNKIISIKQIIKILTFISVCELILYSLQYILFNQITFLYVNSNYRYGDTRLYFYNILIRLFLFISVDAFFYGTNRITNIIFISLSFFILLVVGKMRMTSLATIISVVFGIMIWRRGGRRKLYSIIFGLILFVLLINTTIGQDTINSIFNYLEGNVEKNLGYRIAGREWYLSALARNPFWGCGYISTLSSRASVAAGYNQNIYLVDNGIWGFVFMYGIIGGIWAVLFFGKMLIEAWRLYRMEQIYFPLLFLLGLIISCQTELHWYWNNGFLILILLVSMMPYLNKENIYNERG